MESLFLVRRNDPARASGINRNQEQAFKT